MWLFPVLFAVASASSYSDSTARYKAFPLTAAAYSDTPERCLETVFTNASLIAKYNVDCDMFKNDKCFGFVSVNHVDRTINIAFRGSIGFFQIVAEVSESVFTKMVPSDIGGNIAEYFYNAMIMIWSTGMRDDVLKMKNKYPNYTFLVTGHSLGGAMATLVAGSLVKLRYATPNNVQLYTFGEPRTGDKAFAAAHDALVPNSFRVTHSHDIVPHIPPKNFDKYYHHKLEEWYKKEDMGTSATHVECDTDESDKCSNGNLLDISIDDHLHYFDKYVSNYGDNGCK